MKRDKLTAFLEKSRQNEVPHFLMLEFPPTFIWLFIGFWGAPGYEDPLIMLYSLFANAAFFIIPCIGISYMTALIFRRVCVSIKMEAIISLFIGMFYVFLLNMAGNYLVKQL